ncbi:hypothetical protein L1N85_26795 [Paenibacillus alkaliterrae]|uniref:hypothetical protein n=1 Tax=Paenibacillus alkaliterrae TaxID=320909 RepID=UPI001F454D99|nr:hypothetical protein [Paenibacillus alkaliterrae]MCF2941930.1 hypothetical protein [Paenibacillus alkaliterrae]
MIENISIEKLNELYVDTIRKCGMYLLSSDDWVIEYNIFEEFDTGVVSFLHSDSLQKLNDAALINDEIMHKSSTLRNKVLELQRKRQILHTWK